MFIGTFIQTSLSPAPGQLCRRWLWPQWGGGCDCQGDFASCPFLFLQFASCSVLFLHFLAHFWRRAWFCTLRSSSYSSTVRERERACSLSLSFSLSHSLSLGTARALLRPSLLKIIAAAPQMQTRTITTTFKHLHRLGVGKLTFEVNISFRQLFFESFNRLHRLEHIKSHQGIKAVRNTFETFKLVLLVDCTLSLSAITSCSSSISSCSSHSSLLRISARARQSYTKHTKQMAP